MEEALTDVGLKTNCLVQCYFFTIRLNNMDSRAANNVQSVSLFLYFLAVKLVGVGQSKSMRKYFSFLPRYYLKRQYSAIR